MQIIDEVDMGAIVFQQDATGVWHEQWFIPHCGHAVESNDCAECAAEERARNEARRKFSNQSIQYHPGRATT